MIFNTPVYFFAFLLPAVILFRCAGVRLRPYIIAVFGALFFLYFSLTTVGGAAGAWCLLIILYQSMFCTALCRKGSKWCIAAVVQAILFLCVFKYLNFFGGLVFGRIENSPLYWKDAFLPLGISFFTFEFIHFAVDIYKGRAERVSHSEFLAFILFFPTMVAGPIKRIQDFLPKLEAQPSDWKIDFHRGITRILYGLAKKFALADALTAVTDHLNSNDISQAQSRWVLVFWLFAYGLKIYFDFSAYSDIAIGSARLFGIKVTENFDSPYLRTNISQFWQHWHISLYRWLIDYIFIPLGGSRVAPPLIYRNLILVMLASGIWHGAGLNFIAWGAWHAFLLCVHRLYSTWRNGRGWADKPTSLFTIFVSWAITFVSVNIGWAFFCMNWETSKLFFHRLIFG